MRAVPIEELSSVWPTAEPWIAKAVDCNPVYEGTLDVLIALARGVYTLWMGENWAAVTQIVRHPRCASMNVIYCGGSDAQDIQKSFILATSLWRKSGIDIVRVEGRAGWERLLGLEPIGTLLQVKL